MNDLSGATAAVSALAADVVIPYPIDMAELSAIQHALMVNRLEARGFRLHPDDLPALNVALYADPRSPALPALAEADPEAHRVERRAVVAAAVHALAADPEAAGWRRTSGGADPLAVEGTPDPAVWGTGTTFQRSLETARLHLDELAAIDELGEAMTGGPVPTRATGLGALLTEADMVEVLGVSLPSLRAWRTKRLYFEYLKFPGQRGPVRYTERGLRAFIDSHLNTPVQV